MKLLSRVFLLLLMFGFSSMTWGANTIILGEDGQVAEEQSETDAKKKSKGKKGKKEGSEEEEEPDCE